MLNLPNRGSTISHITFFFFDFFFFFKVEAPAAGAAEAASFHASGIQQQHAESRRSHHPGHEHCPALHESAGQPYTR